MPLVQLSNEEIDNILLAYKRIQDTAPMFLQLNAATKEIIQTLEEAKNQR